MDPKLLANAIGKWVHLSSAAYVVGSLIYIRYILWPSVSTLSAEERKTAWEPVRRKSFRWMSYAMLLLLLTGMDNIFKARKTLGGLSADMSQMYWTVFWIKIGLFVAAFVMVHFLFVRVPAFRSYQENPRSLVTILMVAALTIIFLSGYLTLTRLSMLAVAG